MQIYEDRIQFHTCDITYSKKMSCHNVSTAAYARSHHETVVIPAQAWAGGLAAAVIIGALAGLLPAIRAARLSPTQALWSI